MKNCKKTFKSVFAIILSVLMLLSAVPVMASAAETQESEKQESSIGQFFQDAFNFKNLIAELKAMIDKLFSLIEGLTGGSQRTEHEYDGGVVVTEPTCLDYGMKVFTCIHCGATYTEFIPKEAHNFENATITTPATCSSYGFRTSLCSNNCGTTYTELIEMIPHTYDSGFITTMPTCAEEGVRTYSCVRNCGASYTEAVEKLPHTYDSGVVTTEPTCTEEGVRTYSCVNNCGTSYTAAVAKIAHKYDNGKVVSSATCENGGLKIYTCVYGCGETYDKIIPAGHDFSNLSLTAETECANGCGTVIPSFNTMVNSLKDTLLGVKYYSCVTQEIAHNDEMQISGLLADQLGGEDNVAYTEITYDPLKKNISITHKGFPVTDTSYVSNLADADVQSITVEKVSKADYLSELPDTYTYDSITYDITELKNTEFPDMYKVTIVLPEEKVEDITKTVSGASAYDKIYAANYRGGIVEPLRSEIVSSFSSLGEELADIATIKTSGTMQTNLVVEYYIDAATFAPVGAKYSHRFDISYNIKMFNKMDLLYQSVWLNMTQDMYMIENSYYVFS